jgi:threonine efflux protein
MLGVEYLVSVPLAFLIVTISPGPANIVVATVAMSAGRRRGLAFGAGLSVGVAFWGAVAATGMGAVLQGSAIALTILKVLGGSIFCGWLPDLVVQRSGRTMSYTTLPVKGGGLCGDWS